MDTYYYFTWSVDGKKPRRLGIKSDAKFENLKFMDVAIAAVLSICPTAEIKKYQVRLVTTQID